MTYTDSRGNVREPKRRTLTGRIPPPPEFQTVGPARLRTPPPVPPEILAFDLSQIERRVAEYFINIAHAEGDH